MRWVSRKVIFSSSVLGFSTTSASIRRRGGLRVSRSPSGPSRRPGCCAPPRHRSASPPAGSPHARAGISPRCHAAPRSIWLVKIVSPSSFAGKLRGVEEAEPVPQPRLKREREILAGDAEFGVAGEIAGDDLVAVDHGAGCGPWSSGPVSWRRPTPPGRRRSACRIPPVATRIALISSGLSAMRTWIWTAPPFCARPAISIIAAPLPSIWAAMARFAPMVTTPVPPTPVITMLWVPVDGRDHGLRQAGEIDLGRGLPFRGAALDRDEGRAEPLETREILVAAGLVDGALAAKFGFHGHDGDAVRLHPAIAAALADIRVDGRRACRYPGRCPRLRRRRFSAAQVWM